MEYAKFSQKAFGFTPEKFLCVLSRSVINKCSKTNGERLKQPIILYSCLHDNISGGSSAEENDLLTAELYSEP